MYKLVQWPRGTQNILERVAYGLNVTSDMGTPIHTIVAILCRDVAFLGSPIIPITLFVFSLQGRQLSLAVLSWVVV